MRYWALLPFRLHITFCMPPFSTGAQLVGGTLISYTPHQYFCPIFHHLEFLKEIGQDTTHLFATEATRKLIHYIPRTYVALDIGYI